MDEMMKEPVEGGQRAESPDATVGQQRTPLRRIGPGLIAGVTLIVMVLAGAAFVGARLVNQAQAEQAPYRGGQQLRAQIKGGAGGAARPFEIRIVPARELPQTEPSVDGVFTKRQDDSIFLGTGDIQVIVAKEDDGTGSKKVNFNGPVIEVVVTHDTQVWQDDTEMPALDRPPPGNGDEFRIQQVVSPGSLDELNENSTVQVWGERRGDRVVATTLAYRN